MKPEETLFAHGLAHVGDLIECAPGMVREVLLEGDDGRLGKLAGACSRAGVAWRVAGRRELVRIGGRDARAALAVLKSYDYVGLDQLLAGLPERAVLLALDGVTDPGNLGAIIRSAVFFGAAGLILPERNASPITATVVRRSAGAVLNLPVVRVTNLVRSLGHLQEAGFWVYGTLPGEGRPVAGEEFAPRSCLVLGSEGKGMRPLVARACDIQLQVPGQFESLNVASFAAVLLYEWARKKNLDNTHLER